MKSVSILLISFIVAIWISYYNLLAGSILFLIVITWFAITKTHWDMDQRRVSVENSNSSSVQNVGWEHPVDAATYDPSIKKGSIDKALNENKFPFS